MDKEQSSSEEKLQNKNYKFSKEKKKLVNLLNGDTLNILIVDDIIADKSDFQCSSNIEKILFNNEIFSVCTNCNFDADCEKYSKVFLSDLKLLAIFVKEMNIDKSFYANENSIYVIDNYKGNISIKELPITEGFTSSDIAESYFSGDMNTEIVESISSIRSKYTKKSKKELYILIILLMVFGGIVWISFFSPVKKITRTPPPKPSVVPLTNIEKEQIRRALSLQSIENIEKEIKAYKENKDLITLRRVPSYRISRMPDIPPVIPILDEEKNVWVYPSGPRRGALQYQVDSTSVQKYAGVGYRLQEKNTYEKSHFNTFVLNETYLNKYSSDIKKLSATEKCLNDALKVPGLDVPFKREDRSIELKIENVTPSDMIKYIKPIIKECPILIEKVNLRDGKFNMRLVLYKQQKDESTTEERIRQNEN